MKKWSGTQRAKYERTVEVRRSKKLHIPTERFEGPPPNFILYRGMIYRRDHTVREVK